MTREDDTNQNKPKITLWSTKNSQIRYVKRRVKKVKNLRNFHCSFSIFLLVSVGNDIHKVIDWQPTINQKNHTEVHDTVFSF